MGKYIKRRKGPFQDKEYIKIRYGMRMKSGLNKKKKKEKARQ